MYISALGWLIGIGLLNCFNALPSFWYLIPTTIIAGLTYIFLPNVLGKLILAIFIGCVYALWAAHDISAWELPKSLENKIILISGQVISLPQITTQFSQDIITFE